MCNGRFVLNLHHTLWLIRRGVHIYLNGIEHLVNDTTCGVGVGVVLVVFYVAVDTVYLNGRAAVNYDSTDVLTVKSYLL